MRSLWGRTVVRPTDGAAGKGCWRKRRPRCNGADRGSRFAPSESERERCVRRLPAGVSTRGNRTNNFHMGKQMAAGTTCWCAHKRKRLVAPGRYCEVSAAMRWRVSLSRRAFEMLEPIAVKVARWVPVRRVKSHV